MVAARVGHLSEIAVLARKCKPIVRLLNVKLAATVAFIFEVRKDSSLKRSRSLGQGSQKAVACGSSIETLLLW